MRGNDIPASAMEPARMPRPEKNWRRVCWAANSRKGFMASILRDRLIQVEDDVGNHRVGGEFGGLQFRLRLRLAKRDRFHCRLRLLLEARELVFERVAEDREF